MALVMTIAGHLAKLPSEGSKMNVGYFPASGPPPSVRSAFDKWLIIHLGSAASFPNVAGLHPTKPTHLPERVIELPVQQGTMGLLGRPRRPALQAGEP